MHLTIFILLYPPFFSRRCFRNQSSIKRITRQWVKCGGTQWIFNNKIISKLRLLHETNSNFSLFFPTARNDDQNKTENSSSEKRFKAHCAEENNRTRCGAQWKTVGKREQCLAGWFRNLAFGSVLDGIFGIRCTTDRRFIVLIGLEASKTLKKLITLDLINYACENRLADTVMGGRVLVSKKCHMAWRLLLEIKFSFLRAFN